MPNAIKSIVAALAVAGLAACTREQNPEQNVVITENIPANADIETVPPDESVANETTGAVSNGGTTNLSNSAN